MKISRTWLQKYFDSELPSAQALADALTFHAFEIEGVEKNGNDDILDVKITANRGHDALSHRGIAKELSAILDIPLSSDPLQEKAGLSQKTDAVSVSIDTPLCSRYIAGYVTGVKVGPSPKWLQERLEAIGQRSINNIVDATNFVMFNLGQPLHAFDAGKLAEKNGYAISVRNAGRGENMIALDGKEYALNDSMLVISDANKNEAIGIAGVKGGMPAAITESTKDIIIESANFNGVSIRKTAAALKLRTDASSRFEQVISPELAAYGMRSVVDLIQKLAGGELKGFADKYPEPQKPRRVSLSVEELQRVLGKEFGEKEMEDSFRRLGFNFTKGSPWEVDIPFERLDLTIPEDLIEEVGRIIGYDRVPAQELPLFSGKPEINKHFYWGEKIREFLVSRGFSEVLTSVFSDKGERAILNKLDGLRPYLRESIEGLRTALAKNIQNKELLEVYQVRLFEIGTVWINKEERLNLSIAVERLNKEKNAGDFLLELGQCLGTPRPIFESGKPSEVLEMQISDIVSEIAEPQAYENLALPKTKRYIPYSRFPYIVRDVAAWVPAGMGESEMQKLIEENAGGLLVKNYLLDRFEKQGRLSLAFRLIFQSSERTLEDSEANTAMEKVYAALKEKGFEIR